MIERQLCNVEYDNYFGSLRAYLTPAAFVELNECSPYFHAKVSRSPKERHIKLDYKNSYESKGAEIAAAEMLGWLCSDASPCCYNCAAPEGRYPPVRDLGVYRDCPCCCCMVDMPILVRWTRSQTRQTLTAWRSEPKNARYIFLGMCYANQRYSYLSLGWLFGWEFMTEEHRSTGTGWKDYAISAEDTKMRRMDMFFLTEV